MSETKDENLAWGNLGLVEDFIARKSDYPRRAGLDNVLAVPITTRVNLTQEEVMIADQVKQYLKLCDEAEKLAPPYRLDILIKSQLYKAQIYANWVYSTGKIDTKKVFQCYNKALELLEHVPQSALDNKNDYEANILCQKAQTHIIYHQKEEALTALNKARLLPGITDETATDINSALLKAGGMQKSGCFIATAAYGTPLALEVVALSQFRDEFLLESKVGCWFVKFYYTLSPPVADFIAQKGYLRFLTRNLFLTPVLRFVKLLRRK